MLDVAVCAKVPLGEWKAGSPTHLHEFITDLSDKASVQAYVPYVAPGYSNHVVEIRETHSRHASPIVNMYDFSAKAQLAILKGRQDVVHWRLDLAQELVLLRAARGLKVAEVNGPLLEEQALMRKMPGPVYWAAKRELIGNLRRFDRITTVSEELKSLLCKEYGVPSCKVNVVYNGVNPSLFQAGHYMKEARAIKESLGIVDKKVLGFVGGLRPWHGVQYAIRMMAGVKHKDTVLCVVGNGHELDNLKDTVKSLGLSDRIFFIGAVPYMKVPAYIEAFDIALAPYPSKGVSNYFNPLKLFEYMAMRKPIVCGNTSWARAFIDVDCGAVIECEDSAKFASCVDLLLDDPQLSRSLASNAMKKALKDFTWEINVKRMMDIYERALN